MLYCELEQNSEVLEVRETRTSSLCCTDGTSSDPKHLSIESERLINTCEGKGYYSLVASRPPPHVFS